MPSMDGVSSALAATPIDLRFLHLVVSQLCHDLVSPVGAVNNGVELIADLGVIPDEEAFNLISKSGQVAAARLRCLRLAWGGAGIDPGIRIVNLQQILADYFAAEPRVQLRWLSTSEVDDLVYAPGALQMLLNAILALAQSLTREGELTVTFASPEPRIPFEIEALGKNLRAPDKLVKMLAGRGEFVYDPRAVFAEFTSILSCVLGETLTVTQESSESVKLAGRLPTLSLP